MNRGGLVLLNFQIQDSQIADLANQILFNTQAKFAIWRAFQKAEKIV